MEFSDQDAVDDCMVTCSEFGIEMTIDELMTLLEGSRELVSQLTKLLGLDEERTQIVLDTLDEGMPTFSARDIFKLVDVLDETQVESLVERQPFIDHAKLVSEMFTNKKNRGNKHHKN